MPRRQRLRKVVAPPGFKGYKPYGHVPNNNTVELHYEEYEAIKLADYDLMNHEEASKLMGISRATFARIYEKARRKIAQALVGSKEIKVVFGNAHLDEGWFICNRCNTRFNLPNGNTQYECPMCRSNKIEHIIKEKR